MRKYFKLAVFMTACILTGCGGSDAAFQGSTSSTTTGGTSTAQGADPVKTFDGHHLDANDPRGRLDHRYHHGAGARRE